ncbi:hypothetical protein DOK67_0001993 [Enterococcus sp. DIV0212c]|uniref:Uncharacterized protein n=1 Tax=Candidatus Enterococcus ikei TaxID=2815326 RepID=A0ABS3GZN0_9ENTE|nr:MULTISPECIES: hypothetical protein [unclassified Enterococcus]MBO0440680.1 hypothetical protein [Enterococcus sp. DIV0869a]MBO1355365.1 hypothetical protein [Enterococcus sp. DIV0212c]
MLVLLLILSVVALVVTVVMQSMVKKNSIGKTYNILAMIQSGCVSAMAAILVILILKGRTLV